MLLLFTGCAQMLGQAIVSTPNRFNPFAGEKNPLPPVDRLLGADDHFFVKVGPPAASLSVSIVEPELEEGTSPHGTILILHGIRNRGTNMLGTARRLAAAGYRTVLVDQRGEGRSSGKHHSYGLQEARDLTQVIDELEQRGLAPGPIGVYGYSYGAATAIHLAGRDRRIKAAVAVAPFSTMRDEVPDYASTILPGIGRVLPTGTMQAAIDEAGRAGDFDPDESDAIAAIRRTRAQVLILHGEYDWLVPPHHGERLAAAAPDHAKFLLLPGLGHVTIWIDPDRTVARHAQQWFDEKLRVPPMQGIGERGASAP